MGTLRDAKHHSAELIWTSAPVTKKENYSLGRMQKACTISLPCCLKPGRKYISASSPMIVKK